MQESRSNEVWAGRTTGCPARGPQLSVHTCLCVAGRRQPHGVCRVVVRSPRAENSRLHLTGGPAVVEPQCHPRSPPSLSGALTLAPSQPTPSPISRRAAGEHFGSLLATGSASDFRRSELCLRDPVGSTGSPASVRPHPCPEERDPVPNGRGPQPRPCGPEEHRLGNCLLSEALGLHGRDRGHLVPGGEQPGLGWTMQDVGAPGSCPGCRHLSAPRLQRLPSIW